MKSKTTIEKISDNWNKKIWGFYDLQFPFNPPPLITEFEDEKASKRLRFSKIREMVQSPNSKVYIRKFDNKSRHPPMPKIKS